MARTYCVAKMELTDISASSDGVFNSVQKSDFSNMDLLVKDDRAKEKEYATLELNQYILDGSKEVMKDTGADDVAFWSNLMSNIDCSFDVNPKITVEFSENHTSTGITLSFVEDYPEELRITWFDLSNKELSKKTYKPNDLKFYCKNQVKNYGKVEIEFIKTRFPKRYIKMSEVLYGVIMEWSDELVITANVVEEVSTISDVISINTAEIEILDAENNFDISNKDGEWTSVERTQEIELTEYKDNTSIPMGTFFIDTFSFSGNKAKFSLIDSVGLMDKYTFDKGEIYNLTNAGIIIEKIFEESNIEKYEIEDEVYLTKLSGHIPIMSCRDALRLVCFSCGAVADDSRSDTIKIYKPNRAIRSVIGIDRKISGGTTVELDEYVSGITLNCSRYTLDAERSDIFDDYLEAGVSRIEFSEPYLINSISTSVGTILEKYTNYLIINVPTAQEVTISGIKYEKNDFAYTNKVEELEAGESPNVKTFDDITLYNAELLKPLTDSILNYYSLRKIVNVKYFLDLESAGRWASIKDINKNASNTLIESQTIDLTSGFIATSKCRGYSTVTTFNYFTTELFAGEIIGVG